MLNRTLILHSAVTRGTALMLCGLVALTGCASRVEQAVPEGRPEGTSLVEVSTPPEPDVEPIRRDSSFEAITAHIDTDSTAPLAVTAPPDDITVDSETYYITGVSDPSLELLMNGEPVENRGELGSFGVFVELLPDENVFTFTQGGESAVLTISRGGGEAWSPTESATRMRPEITVATLAGEPYTLSCIAPSGAAVTADVGGFTVELAQSAAASADGVPAAYSGSFTPPKGDGTVNLGHVSYTLSFGGKVSVFQSAGELYAASGELVVTGVNTSSTVFVEEGNDDLYDTTLLHGAVDCVTEIGSSMYRLGMGGWVFKESVVPVEGIADYENIVGNAEFAVRDKWEEITLHGTALPPYRANWYGGERSITFFNTTGVGNIETPGSKLLDSVKVSEEDGAATLEFYPRPGAGFGGYLVVYDGNSTKILLRPAPHPEEGGLPLSGITVMLDPGHGGSDQGAGGVARSHGPAESEINLATALAARGYLEALGAQVRMSRESDVKIEMNDLTAMLRDPELDLVISLHCNSISASLDGTAASGTETHYFEQAALPLAKALQQAVCERTGRKDRGPKHSYYRVALNSWAPSVLLEMGFLTNPAEYDSLRGKQGVYDMAAAIGDAVVNALS